jgi:hypothetical protein
MVKIHRAVVERLRQASPTGPESVGAVLLETPFGFQTNASEIAARAAQYFRDSVGARLDPVGILSSADLAGPAGDRRLSALAAAPLVFSGPGSPTYALHQWGGTLVPSVIGEKLAVGGAVTFASAAALTLGAWTVPVYEIYKAGEAPYWASGLDLLGPFGLGLHVAVIAHYDNAEGGTHDTRYCYLGEKRLASMEQDLPDGAFVLGVDEHTALSLDLEAETASVIGRGTVTVRVRGRSERLPAEFGAVPITRLAELAHDLTHRRAPSGSQAEGRIGGTAESRTGGEAESPTGGQTEMVPSRTSERAHGSLGSPLLGEIRRLEESFRTASLAGDLTGMVTAALGIHDELWAWRADTFESDEVDRGRAALGAMLAELGDLAELGTRDPADTARPYVDLVLELRQAARRDRRFEEADVLRLRLEALGVAVHDTPDATTWELEPKEGPANLPKP